MLSGYLTAPMRATRGCGKGPSQDAGTNAWIILPVATQQTVTNLVRSGRKQR